MKSDYQQSPLVVGLMAGFIGSKVVDRSGDGLVRGAIFVELGLVGVTGVNLTSIR